MISKEPNILVGIIEGGKEIHGCLNGLFELPNSIRIKGLFHVKCENGLLILYDDEGIEVTKSKDFTCQPVNNATFTIKNVTIGKNFHWEKKEEQTFKGSLRLIAVNHSNITAINEIGIESYIKSVISSEMSAEAPFEFLKAQAIVSRSWLVAMLEKRKRNENQVPYNIHLQENENEIKKWYDIENHSLFDVCADDHCQRYQGITKIISKSVEEAVDATRGVFLIHDNQICDARFSKACGGRTELFENCWEDVPIPYLQSISDSETQYKPITNEAEAEQWIFSLPESYCNTSDENVLRQILPSFDQKTEDFFRWKVEYSREELEEILRTKSGIDFGILKNIIPIKRGPSGRIFELKLIGTKRTIVVGKELEIRRWLSKSHLYSSAFIVKLKRDVNDLPVKFTFYGAGWGHGVGLCQIGAAMMAMKGYTSDKILNYYFKDVEIKKLY